MRSSSALLRPSAEIADRGYPRRSGARGKCFPAPRCSAPPRRSWTKAIRGEAERAENAFQLRAAPPLRGWSLSLCRLAVVPIREIRATTYPRRSGACGKNAFQLRAAPPLRGWSLSLRRLAVVPIREIRATTYPRRSGACGKNAFQLRAAPPLRGWSLSLPTSADGVCRSADSVGAPIRQIADDDVFARSQSARKKLSGSALLRPSADGLCRSADWRLYQSRRSGQRLIRGEAECAEQCLSAPVAPPLRGWSLSLPTSADGVCRSADSGVARTVTIPPE
jgi:hypothetical protein